MRVSAKVDYALRALAELAVAPPGPVKAEQLATAQEIPLKFLENILLELRRAEIVASQRGTEGGYRLARPAEEVSLADVIRAVEGPIATVRGSRPEDASYTGAAAGLRDVWIELRTSMRGVLEQTSLADLVDARRADAEDLKACAHRQAPARRVPGRADVDDLPLLQLELLAAVARQLGPERLAVRPQRARRAPRSRGGRSARSSPRPPRCSGSVMSSRSCGRTHVSPTRLTGPTKLITNSVAGSS